MKIGIIGLGAIGRYVRQQILTEGHEVGAVLVRPQRMASREPGWIESADDLPGDIHHIVDCAGHQALKQHGPKILERGIELITVSIGALADSEVMQRLQQAAEKGGARLHLASGAIGALDCLQAARVGRLASVTYIGRKPPAGWKGSPAQERLDLDELDQAAVHFEGSARVAAMDYPKNANVAAAVALAGLGFDETRVQLIADPGISENIHEVHAEGDFGRFDFEIRGRSLPDNPRSSALAAMSVISRLQQSIQSVGF
ncbi:MAG: aspartate dehydrogenase [Xanthomonadales bacterium]|nr:aspartate dehydrogenase [Xanthomonadales bacterium]